MTVINRKVLIIIFSIFFTGLMSTGASAHTSLTSSNPVDNSVIQEIQPVLELNFTDELVGIGDEIVNTVELQGPGSELINTDSLLISGGMMTLYLPNGDYQAGKYSLSYRVVSGDGHPVEGSISFTTEQVQTIKAEIATPYRPADPAENERTETSNSDPKLGIFIGIILGFLFLGGFALIRIFGNRAKNDQED